MTGARLLKALRHLKRLPEVARCAAASREWWKLTTCYVGLAPFRPFETTLRDGCFYRLEEYYDLETLWQIYFHKVYSLQPSDRVIVDLGANIGMFACFAATTLPQSRVYSAEPFPATYQRLQNHVKRNELSARVCCYQTALASAQGFVSMAAEGTPSQMARVLEATQSGTNGEVDVVQNEGSFTQVPATTLASFLEAVGPVQVDLLKIDIEGSEYDVLLAASAEQLNRVKRIDVEYHHHPQFGKNSIVQHLSQCGFHVTSDHGSGDYGVLHLSRA